MNMKEKFEQMKKELDLTDEQVIEIKKITEPHIEKIKSEKKALMENMENIMKKVLSEEQLRKFESLKENCCCQNN